MSQSSSSNVQIPIVVRKASLPATQTNRAREELLRKAPETSRQPQPKPTSELAKGQPKPSDPKRPREPTTDADETPTQNKRQRLQALVQEEPDDDDDDNEDADDDEVGDNDENATEDTQADGKSEQRPPAQASTTEQPKPEAKDKTAQTQPEQAATDTKSEPKPSQPATNKSDNLRKQEATRTPTPDERDQDDDDDDFDDEDYDRFRKKPLPQLIREATGAKDLTTESRLHPDALTLSDMPKTIFTPKKRKQFADHFDYFDEWSFPVQKQGIFWNEMTRKQQQTDDHYADIQRCITRAFQPFLNLYNTNLHQDPGNVEHTNAMESGLLLLNDALNVTTRYRKAISLESKDPVAAKLFLQPQQQALWSEDEVTKLAKLTKDHRKLQSAFKPSYSNNANNRRPANRPNPRRRANQQRTQQRNSTYNSGGNNRVVYQTKSYQQRQQATTPVTTPARGNQASV